MKKSIEHAYSSQVSGAIGGGPLHYRSGDTSPAVERELVDAHVNLSASQRNPDAHRSHDILPSACSMMTPTIIQPEYIFRSLKRNKTGGVSYQDRFVLVPLPSYLKAQCHILSW